MDEAYIGEIRMVAFGFAPVGWALCDGSLLPIASNSPLFSLIGTTYGGNGTTNFALPDLRGRSAVGVGQGSGLSSIAPGQAGGVENVSLTAANLPQHTHVVAVPAAAARADVAAPGSTAVLAEGYDAGGAVDVNLYTASNATTTLKPFDTAPAGSGTPVAVRNPYLGVNFIICTQGIYPSRP
ncbi:MAG: phage tail protein [Betaproteobacteria bacterium]